MNRCTDEHGVGSWGWSCLEVRKVFKKRGTGSVGRDPCWKPPSHSLYWMVIAHEEKVLVIARKCMQMRPITVRHGHS